MLESVLKSCLWQLSARIKPHLLKHRRDTATKTGDKASKEFGFIFSTRRFVYSKIHDWLVECDNVTRLALSENGDVQESEDDSMIEIRKLDHVNITAERYMTIGTKDDH